MVMARVKIRVVIMVRVWVRIRVHRSDFQTPPHVVRAARTRPPAAAQARSLIQRATWAASESLVQPPG